MEVFLSGLHCGMTAQERSQHPPAEPLNISQLRRGGNRDRKCRIPHISSPPPLPCGRAKVAKGGCIVGHYGNNKNEKLASPYCQNSENTPSEEFQKIQIILIDFPARSINTSTQSIFIIVRYLSCDIDL